MKTYLIDIETHEFSHIRHNNGRSEFKTISNKETTQMTVTTDSKNLFEIHNAAFEWLIQSWHYRMLYINEENYLNPGPLKNQKYHRNGAAGLITILKQEWQTPNETGYIGLKINISLKPIDNIKL